MRTKERDFGRSFRSILLLSSLVAGGCTPREPSNVFSHTPEAGSITVRHNDSPTPAEDFAPTYPPLTSTPAETLVPEETPISELPWGGTKTAYAFHYTDGTNKGERVVLDEILRQYYIPVSAEEWAKRMTLTDTNGTVLPAGLLFTTVPIPDTHPEIQSHVVLAYVSAIVDYGYANSTWGNISFAVLQFPVREGTNYFFLQLSDKNQNGFVVSHLPDTALPSEWLGENISYDTIQRHLAPDHIHIVQHRPMKLLLEQYIGKMIFVEITRINPDYPVHPSDEQMKAALLDARLFPPNSGPYYPLVEGFLLPGSNP